mmetsp:Transcript_82454/g.163643  ORF Transcript_82454/g.163643 Transcript_82454/m.163643 type:complete len:118 (+) Transcript_82454:518-871(+)
MQQFEEATKAARDWPSGRYLVDLVVNALLAAAMGPQKRARLQRTVTLPHQQCNESGLEQLLVPDRKEIVARTNSERVTMGTQMRKLLRTCGSVMNRQYTAKTSAFANVPYTFGKKHA